MADPIGYTNSGRPIFALHPERGIPVCGAQRQDGTVCLRWKFLKKNGRCQFHCGNGRARKVDASKVTTYLPYVPASMVKQLEALIDNPTPLSVRNEIDLLTVRLQDIVSELEDFLGYGSRKWLESVVEEARRKLPETDSDPDKELIVLRQFLEKVDGILQQVADEDKAWYRFSQIAEQKASLIRTETGLLEQQKGVIRADQAFMMIHSIMSRMKELATPKDMLGIPQESFIRMQEASGATEDQILAICSEFGRGLTQQLARYVRTLVGSSDPDLEVDDDTVGSEAKIRKRYEENVLELSSSEISDEDE